MALSSECLFGLLGYIHKGTEQKKCIAHRHHRILTCLAVLLKLVFNVLAVRTIVQYQFSSLEGGGEDLQKKRGASLKRKNISRSLTFQDLPRAKNC